MNSPAGKQGCATTCPYCGVGCGVIARADQANGLTVVADPSHPANRGKVCVKGSTLADTQHDSQRLTAPMINGQAASWDAALDAVADGFQAVIDTHGPNAVAFYLSGQLLTEDYYVANKLMKGFIGSSNVDTNSRLCMASAVAAHKRAFGEDVVPCSYEDLDHCDLLVMVGSNAAWTHPVLYQRIAESRAAGNLRVIVVDPRRTATCEIADQHLAITPGSDVALFNGLLTYLSQNQETDQCFVHQHTTGSEESLAAAQLDLDACALATGIERDSLQSFFEAFAASENTVSFFSQGVNQSTQGTDKANAIINCHLLTGRIGKLGNGPFSITGQPNAMGGREVGGMANQLAAHMDFSEDAIDRVARFWKTDSIARAPGLKAVEMFQAIASGEIKAVWIMGTNPAVSLPDSYSVREALQRCPLVVVSDCTTNSDTVQLADIALPAKGWGEKDGTVTNSERFISRQRRFANGPTQARADWDMIRSVAQRMGYGKAFNYNSPGAIFSEHAALTAFENVGARQLDLSALSGLTPDEYDQLRPTQWPLHGRPFSNNRFSTADQRAHFVATHAATPAQHTSPQRPLIANSGRIRDQWHSMTRTGTSAKLFNHRNEPFVELSAADAAKYAIGNGDLVEVAADKGVFRGIARIDQTLMAGQLFLPIHWSSSFTGAGLSNTLYQPHTDPFSGQPESKHGAASLRKVPVVLWLRLVTDRPLPNATLAAWEQRLDYWARVPAPAGTVYEAAASASVEDLIQTLEAATATHHSWHITDTTESTATARVLAHTDNKEKWLLAIADARSTLADPATLFEALHAKPLAPWQALALTPMSAGPVGPMICSCFEVHSGDIESAIASGERTVAALGAKLRCGTNCGSCVPELQQLLNTQTSTQAVAS